MILLGSGTSVAVMLDRPIAAGTKKVTSARANGAVAKNNLSRRTFKSSLRGILNFPEHFGNMTVLRCKQQRFLLPAGSPGRRRGERESHFPVAKFPASSVRCLY